MIHFIRFNVVGVLGFALQSGALFALTHREHPLGYLAATAAAVELAVLNNFVWHQRWTWSDRPSATTGETLRRLAKFNITNGAVSITGNLVLMSILVFSRRSNRVLCEQESAESVAAKGFVDPTGSFSISHLTFFIRHLLYLFSVASCLFVDRPLG